MEIKVFWQANCPNCAPVKQLVRAVAGGSEVKVRELDISDIDGMSEAAFHAVMGTPTTIIVDSNDSEIASWRSQVPSKEELQDAINC